MALQNFLDGPNRTTSRDSFERPLATITRSYQLPQQVEHLLYRVCQRFSDKTCFFLFSRASWCYGHDEKLMYQTASLS